MRVLLSTIGSRGEVQPVVALAMQLRALDHEVRVCAPPDFREWIESLGIAAIPIGPLLRRWKAPGANAPQPRLSPEQLRQLGNETVATQFATITEAARGCDVLVACGALQFAARSVTESLGIRYVYASYCPITLPSPHHAPPPIELRGDSTTPGSTDFAALWARDALRWNGFAPVLNTHRGALGLPPVTDVRSHIFTDRPWLAADATLGPWPDSQDLEVFQTGAWILPDARPLSAELEAFLGDGEPPVYFGFGSMRVPNDVSPVILQAARAIGRRAIIARGWAELSVADQGLDCIVIDEVNQQALFPRVAAVVHHGGAGTTTAAARAGAPQVIVPQMYDQHYWARRIAELGIGRAHSPGIPTSESLLSALRGVLQPDVAARARSVAARVRSDGAAVAARRVIAGT